MDLDPPPSSLQPFLNHNLTLVGATILLAFVTHLLMRATIARIVHRLLSKHHFTSQADQQKREQTLVTIFRTAGAVLIWLCTIIGVLWILEVSIAPLMTGAGLLGIVVGFGAQSAIRDFLAGIFIIAENQYRVGDIITLRTAGTDVSGVVEDITIRITRLRDLDGNLHIVQNGAAEIVTNRTFKFANVNIDINVAYESDIDTVERIMNDVGNALAADAAWAEHIFEPIQFLRVEAFGESAVQIKAIGKVEPAQQWNVAGEFRRRLMPAFAKQHISMPFNQIVVHQASHKNKV